MARGHDWAWCPCCRSTLERTERGGTQRPTCPACGFVYFSNPPAGAAAVIQDARGRVLLVQRRDGLYGAGRWCFPCGFIEWGEEVRAAAAREAREEAGVEVSVGEVLQILTTHHEPDRPAIGIWFAAELLDTSVAPVAGDDAVAVGWFDPASPPPLAFPDDVMLMKRLAQAR